MLLALSTGTARADVRLLRVGGAAIDKADSEAVKKRLVEELSATGHKVSDKPVSASCASKPSCLKKALRKATVGLDVDLFRLGPLMQVTIVVVAPNGAKARQYQAELTQDGASWTGTLLDTTLRDRLAASQPAPAPAPPEAQPAEKVRPQAPAGPVLPPAQRSPDDAPPPTDDAPPPAADAPPPAADAPPPAADAPPPAADARPESGGDHSSPDVDGAAPSGTFSPSLLVLGGGLVGLAGGAVGGAVGGALAVWGTSVRGDPTSDGDLKAIAQTLGIGGVGLVGMGALIGVIGIGVAATGGVLLLTE